MKNIILIATILVNSLLFSQQIYPLNTSAANLPNGSYLKDLNGELNSYVGFWKGMWEGKTLYIEFRKIKYYLGTTPTNGIYKDKILGERKVIEANGTVSIDRISNFDNNQYHEFSGILPKYTNPLQEQIYFVTGICGKTADLDVAFLNAAKTHMSLHLIYRPSYIDETCPYYNSIMQGNDYPINFPKDIVLTKQ